MDNATAEPKIVLHARVFRIAHDRRPWFVPKALWLALGKRRVPFTGRWEDLGQIASSEEGTASAKDLSA